jgi:hypothetical protein
MEKYKFLALILIILKIQEPTYLHAKQKTVDKATQTEIFNYIEQRNDLTSLLATISSLIEEQRRAGQKIALRFFCNQYPYGWDVYEMDKDFSRDILASLLTKQLLLIKKYITATMTINFRLIEAPNKGLSDPAGLSKEWVCLTFISGHVKSHECKQAGNSNTLTFPEIMIPPSGTMEIAVQKDRPDGPYLDSCNQDVAHQQARSTKHGSVSYAVNKHSEHISFTASEESEDTIQTSSTTSTHSNENGKQASAALELYVAKSKIEMTDREARSDEKGVGLTRTSHSPSNRLAIIRNQL